MPFLFLLSDHQVGKFGEALAAHYLEGKGYVVWFRNWQNTHGEIDLVCIYQDRLIFVEVKTRRSQAFKPLEAINQEKQAQLNLLALEFMENLKPKLRARRLRKIHFEYVGIEIPSPSSVWPWNIQHHSA